MKNILGILLLLTLTLSLPTLSKLSEDDITLQYSGVTFKVPKNHVFVGFSEGKDDFLAFKYNNKPVENYIAFSKMIWEPNKKYDCEIDVFLKDVFIKNKNTKCNKDELETFEKVFLKGNDQGVWKNNGFTLYYTISIKDAFMFVINPNRTVIKVDSDFLSKSDLKRIARDILN